MKVHELEDTTTVEYERRSVSLSLGSGERLAGWLATQPDGMDADAFMAKAEAMASETPLDQAPRLRPTS